MSNVLMYHVKLRLNIFLLLIIIRLCHLRKKINQKVSCSWMMKSVYYIASKRQKYAVIFSNGLINIIYVFFKVRFELLVFVWCFRKNLVATFMKQNQMSIFQCIMWYYVITQCNTSFTCDLSDILNENNYNYNSCNVSSNTKLTPSFFFNKN